MDTLSKTRHDYLSTERAVTFVPLKIRRRGGRQLVVLPTNRAGPEARSEFNLPIMKALGNAFYWRKLLEEGAVANVEALARQEGLDKSWVSETLRFTLIAPGIVEAIFSGKQPRTLTLQALRSHLPYDWALQRELYGFAELA